MHFRVCGNHYVGRMLAQKALTEGYGHSGDLEKWFSLNLFGKVVC